MKAPSAQRQCHLLCATLDEIITMNCEGELTSLDMQLNVNKAVIDLYEPVSDSILKPNLVSWYK